MKGFIFLALSQSRHSEIFGGAQFAKRLATPVSLVLQEGINALGIFYMVVALGGACFTHFGKQTLAPEHLPPIAQAIASCFL